MTTTPKAVFFDVGNTLLFPDWQHILEPLVKRGFRPTLDQLRALERRTKQEFDEIATSGKIDHSFWHIFHSHLLEMAGITDEDVLAALTEGTRTSANWNQIQPGTREVLERIGKQYRIGVISNADGKIAEVLNRCGVGDCFLTITDSGLVGHEKPHPAIFAAALREMNTEPEESLYVGDVYSVDYAGATRAGMQAMLFDVAGAYREKGLPRVESLEELRAHLGC